MNAPHVIRLDTHPMPLDARMLLIRAASTAPQAPRFVSADRLAAIDRATNTVRAMYPHLFRDEPRAVDDFEDSDRVLLADETRHRAEITARIALNKRTAAALNKQARELQASLRS